MFGKGLTVFRDIAEPGPSHHVGPAPCQILTENADGAVPWRQQSGDRLERRALACAIAAKQRHRLSLRHLEAEVEKDLALAVEHIEAFDTQDDAAAHIRASSCGVPK